MGRMKRPSPLIALLGLLPLACSEGAAAPVTPEADPARSADMGPSTEAADPAEGAKPAAAESTRRNVRPGLFTFGTLTHDFGRVDGSRLLACEFAFRNDTDEVIEVKELKASCGCTTTQLERESLAPGEEEVVKVDWMPKGFGAQTQTVDVLTRAGRKQTLYVKAVVEPRIMPYPTAADFGEVQVEEARAMQLTLEATEPAEVLGVRPEVPGVLADFVPRGGAGVTGQLGVLDVRLLPRSIRGSFGTSLVLELRVPATDDEGPRDYEMKVPVRAKVFGAVRYEPSNFLVGRVDPGGSIDYRVRARRPDGSAFRFVQAEFRDSPFPEAELVQESGSDAEGFYLDLFVRGPVGDFQGVFRAKVDLLTDVKGDRMQSLSVIGNVRPKKGR